MTRGYSTDHDQKSVVYSLVSWAYAYLLFRKKLFSAGGGIFFGGEGGRSQNSGVRMKKQKLSRTEPRSDRGKLLKETLCAGFSILDSNALFHKSLNRFRGRALGLRSFLKTVQEFVERNTKF
jgi:hypothetical protein